MPNTLSNMRIARSVLHHETGNTPTTQEMDFDLGLNEAVEIFAVMGVPTSFAVLTPSAALVAYAAAASLHIEDDNPRDLDIVAADDDLVVIDDEVIFLQGMHVLMGEDSTNHDTTAALAYNPQEPLVYTQPILAAINLRHRLDASGTQVDVVHHMEVHYRYVRLTDSELIQQVARRR